MSFSSEKFFGIIEFFIFGIMQDISGQYYIQNLNTGHRTK